MIVLDLSILNQKGTPMFYSDVFANRPAAGVVGRIFISTDTSAIYRDTGTGWDLIADGAGASTNIYNSDGTLTANRTVTLNGKTLTFTDGITINDMYVGNRLGTSYDTYNTIIGNDAALNVSTALEIVAVGIEAIKAGGNDYATAVGAYALTTSTGTANTAIGHNSLLSATTAKYQTALGTASGRDIVANDYGVFLGSYAGAGVTGTGNIIIEAKGTYDPATGITTGQYNTILGSGITGLPAATSNNIILSDGQGNIKYRWNGSTNTEITDPLHIVGTTSPLLLLNNTTTANTYITLQNQGLGKWRIGNNYSAGTNHFQIHDIFSSVDRLSIYNTGSIEWNGYENITDIRTYSTGTIQTLTANKQLTIPNAATISSGVGITSFIAGGITYFGGSVTIPNTTPLSSAIANAQYQFTAPGATITLQQATGIRAASQLNLYNSFGGANSGTFDYMSTLTLGGYYNASSGVTTPVITNVYQLLINNISDYGHTFTFTNRWGIYQNGSSDRNYFAGNTLIGTNVDGGQKFQVQGDAFIKGSGNTSSTYALRVQESGGGDLLAFRSDYLLMMGSITLGSSFGPSAGGDQAGFSYAGIRYRSGRNGDSNYGADHYFTNYSGGRTATASASQFMTLNGGFAPTSGTGTYVLHQIQGTINQTGGANGITRGLYVNPTLTAAADWRSIEWSNTSGWGLYGAGTANNYMAGSLGIGNTSVTSSNIRVFLSLSSTRIYGIRNDASIDTGTSSAIYYSSATRVPASGTVTTVRHYYAEEVSIGAGAAITTQSGYSVSANLTSATNNYAFQGSIPSGSNRWNLYMDGTAANYFAGVLNIGTTTLSGYSLDVNGTARVQGNLTISTGGSNITGQVVVSTASTGIGSTDGILRVTNTGSTNVNNIQISNWTTYATTNRTQIGFIERNSSGALSISSQITSGFIGTNISVIEFFNNDTGSLSYVGKFHNLQFIVGGTTTTTPDVSAKVQIDSTTQGFLMPRMTGSQAEAIGTPATGLLIYATNGNGATITTTGWWGYDGATWVKLN